jgi:hypothetical protein
MTARYNFLAHQNYGFDDKRQADIPVPDRDRYAKAILAIAAADGLSEKEREYFANLSHAMDMPEEMINHYLSADPKAESLSDLLAPLRGRNPVPYLLYDAIKVASVDGYAEKERLQVNRAAELLGVNKEHLTALEGLVSAENAVRTARLAVFATIEAASPS